LADIETYLDTIANGVYGRDVRAAIVNAIRQCYADGHAGVTDEQARQDIATIKNKIGTKDISSLGSSLTEAVKKAYNNQYFDITDTNNNHVNIGIHDWCSAFFASNGTVNIYVPLDKRLPSSYPAERIESDSGKPYITGRLAFNHPNDNQLQAVGRNGWKTAPISTVSFQSARVTYNRSALFVVLGCRTILQPVNEACLVSLDATFTFTDGT
jgi:hypothetical protein